MHLVIGLVMAMISAASVPRVDPAAAAAVEKIPVFLQAEANDPLGAAYVAKFREALAQSPTYRAVPDPAAAKFIVGFLTMDPNEAEKTTAGPSTVAAVTLQRENAPGLNELIYSWVMVARPEKVDSLVNELVAAIDQEIKMLTTVQLVN